MDLTPVKPVERRYDYDLYQQKQLIILSRSPQYSKKRVCDEYSISKSTFRNWQKKIDLRVHYEKGVYSLHPGKDSSGKHLEPLLTNIIDSASTLSIWTKLRYTTIIDPPRRLYLQEPFVWMVQRHEQVIIVLLCYWHVPCLVCQVRTIHCFQGSTGSFSWEES